MGRNRPDPALARWASGVRVVAGLVDAAGVQAVMRLMEDNGHRALLVGGCVRDALRGRPVGDIDIATDALPDRVIALAEASGLRTLPTGLAHGTVTVLAEGVPHEVTTFRRDVATDGRHAIVAFTDDVAADAARRDLTMNALYADRAGRVIDPLGGLDDALAGRVRFVGDAAARIREDYLRILRFFRFQAWFGAPAQGIDAEALAACAALADGLDGLSDERVTGETVRLLAAPDPAPAAAAMAAAGVLARVLPGAEAAILAVLVHLEQTAGATPDAMRRLAALGGAADRLRLSRAQARRLALLRGAFSATAGTAELAWRHGADDARDVELLRAAGYGAPLSATLEADLARGAAATFPISAADLMPELAGPALGRRLRALEAEWIASDLVATRADLLT